MEADADSACHFEIDPRFCGEWIEFGMVQLDAYLANHTRFAQYCRGRDAQGFRRLESAILRIGQHQRKVAGSILPEEPRTDFDPMICKEAGGRHGQV
jgi:hypothetical protein